MQVYCGIDIGTSFLKSAQLDLEKSELHSIRREPFPAFLPGPVVQREVDPEAVLRAVEALLTEQCDGIVLCGQMHGFVLVDSRGNAVSNYISWLDQRVPDAEFQTFAARLTQEELGEIGNEFRPGIAAPILAWMAARGELEPGTTPVTIADYVAGRLCDVRPALDPTQAASLGALRLGDLSWQEGVLGKLGIEGLTWPEVRPGALVGHWHGVPVFASIGDQQCALAGALLEDGELSINISTGSQVALITAEASGSPLQTRPYFGGRYLRTITHIPAGRALSGLIALLTELGGVGEEEAWQRIEAAVAEVPSTDVEAAVTFFPGPCGDTGFLRHLTQTNMRVGHIFRAVYESMALNYEACARRLDPDGTARKIVFSGGLARKNRLLRDLTATALGLPYRLSPHPEDTLYGLLVLAREFHRGGTGGLK